MASSTAPDILQVLLCPICHDSVSDTVLCPKCCQHFCRNCICTWLNSNSSTKTCPQCRARLAIRQLIKCPRFDELQEIILQGGSGSFCQQHSKQQLSLFCNQCETCICVTCYFSGTEHAPHKERIVPLEITFVHHKQKLSESLAWLQERYMEVNKYLDTSQESVKLLQECKDKIFELKNTSRKLISGEASANNLLEIIKFEKSVDAIRQKLETEYPVISDIDQDTYVPDPSKLTFNFSKPKKASQNNYAQEAFVITNDGLWNCQIRNTEKQFKCYLTLVQGKPSKYAVAIGNQPEKVVYLEPGIPVELRTHGITADTGNETYALVINLRQTYKDRCQQLQDFSQQLEKEKLLAEATAVFLRRLACTIVPVTLGFFLYWYWHECPVPVAVPCTSWHGLW